MATRTVSRQHAQAPSSAPSTTKYDQTRIAVKNGRECFATMAWCRDKCNYEGSGGWFCTINKGFTLHSKCTHKCSTITMSVMNKTSMGAPGVLFLLLFCSYSAAYGRFCVDGCLRWRRRRARFCVEGLLQWHLKQSLPSLCGFLLCGRADGGSVAGPTRRSYTLLLFVRFILFKAIRECACGVIDRAPA